ncbi:class F sortase [Actinomadura darangshiensis]|uniref:class F sortase n=1 Tax=Actinomadura darangshiensis TaxID=705336 RepID=UPI00140781F6|nr:class F sortase [Actinomadura darangshiensis]
MRTAAPWHGDRQARVLGLTAAVCGVAAATTAITSARGQAPQAPLAATPGTWSAPHPAPSLSPLPAAPPTHLAIPTIGIDTKVTRVGLRPDGTLQPPRPPHQDQAAWYAGSATPGQTGTAIIEGHLDSASGPSVFYRLGELRPGQRVKAGRADGTTAVFTVDVVRRFPKRHFPTRAVYTNTSTPSLRLITCGGDFNPRIGHYRDNTVAFAHLTDILRQ